MASLTQDGNSRVILFVCPTTGQRKTLRLGKRPKKQAESLLHKVEALIACQQANLPMDADLAQWVGNLPRALAERLAKVGLIYHRAYRQRLGEFLEAYLDGRKDLKDNTRRNLTQAKRNLIEYFGRDKCLRDITAADAEAWQRWLRVFKGHGRNTVARTTGRAKQFFRFAVKGQLLDRNPFEGLNSAVHGNESRLVFVTQATANAVLNALDDPQWRLIFALARYGGLRRDETLHLRWEDVDWDKGIIRVRSPKTEHHPGGERRKTPIFAELRPTLEEAYRLRQSDTGRCIPRYEPGTNLGPLLTKRIKRAGLKPWGKPFQNLRSSRETELVEAGYPLHEVSRWIGNSETVARKHYLQNTQTQIDRACRFGAQGDESESESLLNQNPNQHPAAGNGTAPQETTEVLVGHGFLPVHAEACVLMQKPPAPRPGIEPGTYGLEGRCSIQLSYRGRGPKTVGGGQRRNANRRRLGVSLRPTCPHRTPKTGFRPSGLHGGGVGFLATQELPVEALSWEIGGRGIAKR